AGQGNRTGQAGAGGDLLPADVDAGCADGAGAVPGKNLLLRTHLRYPAGQHHSGADGAGRGKLTKRGCCKTKVEQQPRFLWKSGSVQYFGVQIVKKFVTKREKWYSKAGLLG